MKILTSQYLESYIDLLTTDLPRSLQSLIAIDITPANFTFYTSLAVVSSSRIEGEQMEVDSYIKHRTQDIPYLPELVEKPNDLYNAYVFAKENSLNLDNFLHCHSLLTAHLLPEKWRGKYRTNEMLVMEHNTGKIQFEAAPFLLVASEMERLWADIELLKATRLSTEEVFYYAALIHLVLACVHPFNDGNGRAARLLEKWFLAANLGDKAWYIRSEQHYYRNVNDYFRNLNRLGMFYHQLDYALAMPFLQMLPGSLAPDN